MIRQCSEFDNLRALVLLYNAIVRSNLEYNTIIWCPLYQNAIHRIEKIQRKFIKFACHKCHIHLDRNNYDNILAYFALSTYFKIRTHSIGFMHLF
jgi:transposase-like protein